MKKVGLVVGVILIGAAVVGVVVPAALDRLVGNVPIVFYGRIVDQDGRGAAGLRVSASATVERRIPTPGLFTVSGYQAGRSTTTDANGDFEISGVKGTSLSIAEFDAPQYGELQHIKRSFSFSGGGADPRIAADPAHRYLFHVWRKGPTDALLTGKVQMHDSKRAGITFTADLVKGVPSERADAEGDLRVTMLCPPDPGSMKTFTWILKVEAVDGGLVEAPDTDYFLYRAPETGYRREYKYTITEPSDGPGVLKRYYTRTRNGALYAAVRLGARANLADEAGAGISYVANPAASRNLELDPSKGITVSRALELIQAHNRVVPKSTAMPRLPADQR